jgi:nucleoside-diphosphate-sugar epimerase
VVKAETEPKPDSEYGRSKRKAELAIEKILADTRQDWSVVRPTLVYGPGNPGNMLRLMRLTRSPIPLPFGAIRNRRTFLYVENLVHLIKQVLSEPGASRQVFNVGDAEVLSTPELVRMLAGLSGRSIRLLPVPVWILRTMAKGGDVATGLLGRSVGLDSYSVERLASSLEVDISLARTRLNWKPPFSTEEGLRRTLSPGGGREVAMEGGAGK